MPDAEQKRQMTPHGLVGAIEEFISDNKRHYLVENRWLAFYVNDILKVARQVRSGGVSSLDPVYRDLVTEFRLAEIEDEKNRRQKEIEEFDREARKLVADAILDCNTPGCPTS